MESEMKLSLHHFRTMELHLRLSDVNREAIPVSEETPRSSLSPTHVAGDVEPLVLGVLICHATIIQQQTLKVKGNYTF